jgi:hypothetical protein
LEQYGQEYLDLPWITVVILVEDAQAALGSFHHRRHYKREKRECFYEVGNGVFSCGFVCNPLPRCVELSVFELSWVDHARARVLIDTCTCFILCHLLVYKEQTFGSVKQHAMEDLRQDFSEGPRVY